MRRFYRPPGMGELPETALSERGELGVSPPYGLPPRADMYVPAIEGGKPQPVDSDYQSNWQSIPFIVGTDVIKLQDFLLRKFMVIQNIDAVGTLYFGFGWTPTPDNALALPPGSGYEPFRYPTNEIFVVASVAGTKGLFIYGS